jgi:1-acyl-sn-glycerol-3-phosphate acyltransferase
MMRNLAYLLYQPYKLLVFLPIVILSTNVLGMLIVAAVSLGFTRLGGKLPVLWARINALAAPSKVRVSGHEQVVPGQSYVVVANHQSHFDILAIYGWLGIDIRWVMKMELRKVPVLGLACEKLGHVYIDRSNSHRAQASIDAAKSQLKNGTSIFFFPEGTRSLDGRLLPFKKGAFKLAKELNLPILPVTIRGSHDILPAKTLNLFPGAMDIIMHPPILLDSDSTEESLLLQARERIQSAL